MKVDLKLFRYTGALTNEEVCAMAQELEAARGVVEYAKYALYGPEDQLAAFSYPENVQLYEKLKAYDAVTGPQAEKEST